MNVIIKNPTQPQLIEVGKNDGPAEIFIKFWAVVMTWFSGIVFDSFYIKLFLYVGVLIGISLFILYYLWYVCCSEKETIKYLMEKEEKKRKENKQKDE